MAAGGFYVFGFAEAKQPIVVGLLHSQTGPLAASEKPFLDAEMLALEEINAAGGLLGRPVKVVSVNGRSDPSTFAQQAQSLITIDKASVIFGCYASQCRKAVKPVVEEANHLLIYPTAYEGLEQSPNIVYTGGPANQEVTPAISWCVEVRKARKFFLIGSDTVWAHVCNALASDIIKAQGGQIVGEEYLLPESTDVAEVIDKIKQAALDVIYSSAGRRDERPLLHGPQPRRCETGTYSSDLEPHQRGGVAGPAAEGRGGPLLLLELLPKPGPFRDRGVRAQVQGQVRPGPRHERRAPRPPTTACALWAQAVTDARTENVTEVLKTIRRQSLDAPEGVVTVDSENLHNWRTFSLGKVRTDGQFEVVFSLTKPIPPVPFPATRPRKEWTALIESLPAGVGRSVGQPGADRPRSALNATRGRDGLVLEPVAPMIDLV